MINIQITRIGLGLLVPLFCGAPKFVDGQPRYYYAGEERNTPVVVVSIEIPVVEGQIWKAKSGNEIGYVEYCNPYHVGKRIGKLTLVRLAGPDIRPDDEGVVKLGAQIDYFMERFGSGKSR